MEMKVPTQATKNPRVRTKVEEKSQQSQPVAIAAGWNQCWLFVVRVSTLNQQTKLLR